MLLCFLYLFVLDVKAQINTQNINIARDKWGVPHIFGKTDEEVAYGLAWAIAEDDFGSVQIHLLASRGQLASVKGKDGAILDLITHLIGARELVDTMYTANTFSPKFKTVLAGYIQGMNDYAAKHPKEVLKKGLFPVTERDLLISYVFNFALFAGADDALTKIFTGTIVKDEIKTVGTGGSNGIAISKNITTDGKTYLDINSHQPLEGPFSWYEAHLCSEEGWNILGGIIPGGVSIGHGANQYLGWTHTVNSPDFTDVYKLEMNPENPLQYKFDGKWETLMERPIKLKVKVAGLIFSKKITTYWSKYGPTLKNDKGYYSMRFSVAMSSLKMPEQHYWMNKATNFKEFSKALDMQALSCFNIVYADRDDNIFYISNGLIPYRDKSYDWKKVLPGNTSKTLWENKYYPVKDLAQVLNPKCGYVFNANNSPFNATSKEDNLKPENFDVTMGYELFDNNRSLRLSELLKPYSANNKMSYEAFKKIKYDGSFSNPLYSYALTNLEDVFKIETKKYPEVQAIIEKFQKWDRTSGIENEEATIFMLMQQFFLKKLSAESRSFLGNTATEAEFIESFRFAQTHLQKYFGSINVPLGKIQLHIRGDKKLPMPGIFDVITAMYGKLDDKGIYRTYQGESYISLVRFSSTGVEIETVNAYGATNRKESPHYNDQMEMYTKQQLKTMTLDKEKILKEAEKVYHPNE